MTGLASLEGARILVTGGAGLIGRACVRSLEARGAVVRVFDRAEGDVTDTVAVRRALAGQNAVVHLGGYAGLGMADAAETYRVNTVGTFTVLLEAAEAGLTKAVYASSINHSGYPLNPAGLLPPLPYDELLAPRIGDEYSLSKQASEDAAVMVAARWGISITGLRFPLTRDVTEDGGAVFARHLRQAMAADARRQAAEGWSYLDVTDAARSIEAALLAHTPAAPGILVAAGRTYLTTPTADAVSLWSGAPDARRPVIPNHDVALDLTLSRTLLGFEAQVLLDEVAPLALVDASEYPPARVAATGALS